METTNRHHSLIAPIGQDLRRCVPGGEPTLPAIVRTYIRHLGFRAVLMYRIASFLHRRGIRVLAHLISNRITRTTGAEIQPQANIGPGLLLSHPVGVVIGVGAVVGHTCTIMQGVTVGEKLAGAPHDYPTLGDNVTVGAHASLLGKITVGDNCIIGANSVVTHDVPKNTVAAGAPARQVRTLSGACR